MAKPVIEKGMVTPKGDWQTPWQSYMAHKNTWAKFQKENFDLEEWYKKKLITYFNKEPSVSSKGDYDRFFNSEDDWDSKIKLNNIRNRIFEEEKERIFPVVLSHTYGHRTNDLEGKTWISHRRVNVLSEMYRRYNPNLKPTKKLPQAYQFIEL